MRKILNDYHSGLLHVHLSCPVEFESASLGKELMFVLIDHFLRLQILDKLKLNHQCVKIDINLFREFIKPGCKITEKERD